MKRQRAAETGISGATTTKLAGTTSTRRDPGAAEETSPGDRPGNNTGGGG
ncbi:MAG: hypothetical protein GX216_08675 [Methanomicrobiales archaeon]|nr:hypothetical protein [Methanomicrobiales archaeon]